MKKWLREYRSMLKPLPIEGLPDLIVFRPLAFLLVKILARFPVTPNQVSVTAILTGIGSGVCLAQGSREGFLAGGLLYGATAVIDCSDGMLARYKGNGSLTGRIVDGIIDYTNGIAIFTGLGIGMSKMSTLPGEQLWAIILLAAMSMILHSILLDHYRSQFYVHALNVRRPIAEEIAQFSAELDRLKKEHIQPVNRLLIRIYLLYCRLRGGVKLSSARYDAERYYRVNRITLKLWQLIELSAHICVLIVAALLYRPKIFLVYTIVIANLWVLIMLPIQAIANRKSLASNH